MNYLIRLNKFRTKHRYDKSRLSRDKFTNAENKKL